MILQKYQDGKVCSPQYCHTAGALPAHLIHIAHQNKVWFLVYNLIRTRTQSSWFLEQC